MRRAELCAERVEPIVSGIARLMTVEAPASDAGVVGRSGVGAQFAGAASFRG